ncbi:MAG: carbon-monoxide dehydrogenase large subunit [Chloroflexi bacterium]|nr:carbon-monoxide dehydrogenase large subunit [Chloroflexota bacterium]
MATVYESQPPTTTPEVGGMGHSRKRVEDARFIRGAGEYIEDVNLPGQLWLDIVRSPYAHARIKGIDASEALKIPGVAAVVTGKDLAGYKLEWMPTLAGDKQAVLPVDEVLFQSQEVAAVIATSRYAAADGVAAVTVDYEPLEVVVDPYKAMQPGAPVLRKDRDQQDNHIWHWESGDKSATDAALAGSALVVKEHIDLPRIHVASIETCGCVADWDAINGHLTLHMTSQAPHAVRTVVAIIAAAAGLPILEHQIRVKTHDIGGGFGGKVPAYPGYVLAVAASFLTGKPVKWIEDRSENLQADSFARDYHMDGELGVDADGRITAVRVKTLADHGAFDAQAAPLKFHAGLFNVVTGSYDYANAFVEVDGVYTNKPPGGVAYRCSFRVTEAVHAIERLVDIAAHERGEDPAEFRLRNFIPPEKFPYVSPTGWEYDSGNYGAALRKAMDMIGYDDLRKEQAEKRARGELMGIGICSFTEIVGAGPSHDFDIVGLKMNDGAELRVHPTGKALLRIGSQTQGQGHETTYAQIVAEELGIPASDVKVEYGDTDTAPYGLGTYGSRSTPVSGAATAVASRKVRDKARKLAAHLLEAAEDDLEWTNGKFSVKGSPDRSTTIQEIAFAAYTNFPAGMEMGLEAVDYYDPPNLTYPFGSYICVVDIEKTTGEVKIRRFVAIDDCGIIINPMIVDGQIHGGLTMGFAPAMLEAITYDELGNNQAGTFMDYLLPSAVETPRWETGKTITPSPHHPLGAKGVGESATVGAPPAIANAVVDALWHLGVRHIDIPLTPRKIWAILHEKGIA